MLESLFFRNNKGLLFIILINDDNDKVIIGNVCFLGAKHCAWCSTCFVSFNPHSPHFTRGKVQDFQGYIIFPGSQACGLNPVLT